MALFGRYRLPHRSMLSRFLAALDQPGVEAVQTLFQGTTRNHLSTAMQKLILTRYSGDKKD
jgi:hypothetical protein